MTNVPETLQFTNTHEWLRSDGEQLYTIGITDFAQEQLGDLVYIDLPNIGDVVDAGCEVAVAESVKTATDIYSPLSGVVVSINKALSEEPTHVNQSPYESGWLLQIKVDDNLVSNDLLDSDSYKKLTTED